MLLRGQNRQRKLKLHHEMSWQKAPRRNKRIIISLSLPLTDPGRVSFRPCHVPTGTIRLSQSEGPDGFRNLISQKGTNFFSLFVCRDPIFIYLLIYCIFESRTEFLFRGEFVKTLSFFFIILRNNEMNKKLRSGEFRACESRRERSASQRVCCKNSRRKTTRAC